MTIDTRSRTTMTIPARTSESLWFRLAWIIVPALIIVLALGVVTPFWMRQIFLITLLALLVSGLNLSFGWAGELNLGLPAMYAAGAYASGYLYINVVNDTILGLIVGAFVSVIVGVVAGIPGLRLGGWALAISSFFLVLLIPPILQLIPKDLLGGYDGLIGIPRPAVFGIDAGREGLLVVAVLITTLWLLLYRNLVLSRIGSALLILQHGDALAPSLGLSRYRLKLTVYAIAAVPVGFAGALFAHLDSFVGAESFTFVLAISALAAAVLAGLRSIYAVIIGAAVVHFMTMYSANFVQFGELAFGLFLVAGGLLLGGGISALFTKWRRRLFSTPADSGDARAVDGVRSIELPAFDGKPLAVRSVTKTFSGVTALNDVSFTARPGQITALIGPNGSGKTTMLNMINGFYRATAGTITLGEGELTGLSGSRVALRGVARTFQTPAIPQEMTTLDVVAAGRIASHPTSAISTMLRLPRFRRVRAQDEHVAAELLSALGLAERAHDPAASLALGTRRMTELARALAAEPALILLDEIASGLDHNEVRELSNVLIAAREAGATILLVEHNFTLVRNLADHVVVLADGELLLEGSPADIEEDPEFLRRFLGDGAGVSGTTVDDASPRGRADEGQDDE